MLGLCLTVLAVYHAIQRSANKSVRRQLIERIVVKTSNALGTLILSKKSVFRLLVIAERGFWSFAT